MKKIIPFLCVFSLIGCTVISEKPLSTQSPKNNVTYKVEYLFEHDGCKVYRFRDDFNYVYFTSCKGETTSLLTDSTGTKYIKSQNSKN